MATRPTAEPRVRETARGRRLLQGTLLLSGAVALPAVANALVRRRAAAPAPAGWGRWHRYAWERARAQGAVAFQELGSGPALLLLHSFGPGHDGDQWLPAAERLAAAHRVYVLDLLGWGRSDKPRLRYTPDLYLDLLEDFLTEIVREPAVVAAAGAIAPYAVRLAVAHPSLLRGVALINPTGLPSTARTARPRALRALLPIPVAGTSTLNLLTSRAALARHLRRDLYAAPERIDAALIDHHWRAAHAPSARPALTAWATGRLDLPIATHLPRLQTPVWLAWGRHSPSTAADLWLHHLPNATLEIFEQSRALPHAEEPDRFASALARWTSSLSSPPS